MAMTVSAADIEFEREVTAAADALVELTALTAHRVAVETKARRETHVPGMCEG